MPDNEKAASRGPLPPRPPLQTCARSNGTGSLSLCGMWISISYEIIISTYQKPRVAPPVAAAAAAAFPAPWPLRLRRAANPPDGRPQPAGHISAVAVDVAR